MLKSPLLWPTLSLSLSLSLSLTLQFAKALALKWQPSAVTEETPLFAAHSPRPQFMFPAYWWVPWLLLVNSVKTVGKSDISEGNTNELELNHLIVPRSVTTWEWNNIGSWQHWGQTQSMEFSVANAPEGISQGPKSSKAWKSHRLLPKRKSGTMHGRAWELWWLPGALEKLVCEAKPARTCKYSNSKVELGKLQP